MKYSIKYSPDAVVHLKRLTKRYQKIVLDGVERSLAHQPSNSSRNRKRMRPNAWADWELRLGDLRVYYVIGEPDNCVSILAVGIKIGNRVVIGGEEISL